jgi:hypothetical protein
VLAEIFYEFLFCRFHLELLSQTSALLHHFLLPYIQNFRNNLHMQSLPYTIEFMMWSRHDSGSLIHNAA